MIPRNKQGHYRIKSQLTPDSILYEQKKKLYTNADLDELPQYQDKNREKTKNLFNSEVKNQLKAKRMVFSRQNNQVPRNNQALQSKSYRQQNAKVKQKSFRKTQKEKFRQELKDKVFAHHSELRQRYKTAEDYAYINNKKSPENIQRQLTSNPRVSPSKTQQFVENRNQLPDDKLQHQRSELQIHQSLIRINIKDRKKTHSGKDTINNTFRNRSRTINKEEVQKGRYSPEKKNQIEISRTIQLNSKQSVKKTTQNLLQIQKFEKISGIQPNKSLQQQVRLPSNRYRIFQENIDLKSKMMQSFAEIENSSTNREFIANNSEYYEQQVMNLTSQFFHDWNKMHVTKSKIYQKLRNQFVTEYPAMRKHYRQYNTSKVEEQSKDLQNLKKFSIMSNEIRLSDIQSYPNLNNSTNSISDHITVTQLKEREQRVQIYNQRKNLQKVFKQAYFWSRTKKKYLFNGYGEQEEKKEMVELKNIQKNLTFMNYIKKKEGKHILGRDIKIRGVNIIKNKDNILQLEKEGTKQQASLKRCLDDAIQDCLRSNNK